MELRATPQAPPTSAGQAHSAPRARKTRPRAFAAFALPIAALVRRELVVALRGRVLPWFVLLLVAVLGILLYAWWPEGEVLVVGLIAQRSGFVYTAFSVIVLASTALVMPGLGAGAIAAERDADTYDQLRLTLLRPSSMLLGKLVNTAGVFLLLYVATFPLFGSVMFLVGLEWSQILGAAVVTFGAAVTCALLGMAGASLFRHTLPAVIAAYVLMLAYMGGVFALLYMLADLLRISPLERLMFDCMRTLTPPGILLDLTGGIPATQGHLPFILYCAVLSAACFGVARLRLNKLAAPVAATAPRLGRKGPTTLAPQAPMPDRLNPVFHRELCYKPRRLRLLRLVLLYTLLAIVCNGLAAVWSLDYRGYHMDEVMASFAVQMLVLAVFAAAYGANMLTKEFEFGNVDFLRTTLVSSHQIVWGKAGAALAHTAPLYLGLVLGSLPLLIAIPLGKPVLLLGWGSLAVAAIFTIALSIAASALSRRTGLAVAGAYGAALFFFVFYLFLAEPIATDWLGVDYGRSRDRLLFFFSPGFALIQTLLELVQTRWYENGQMVTLEIPISDALAYWFKATLYHLAFSAACIEFAVYAYVRRCREGS